MNPTGSNSPDINTVTSASCVGKNTIYWLRNMCKDGAIPNFTEETYDKIVDEIWNIPALDAEKMWKDSNNSEKLSNDPCQLGHLVKISTAYSVMAIREEQNGERDRASGLVGSAAYTLGLIRAASTLQAEINKIKQSFIAKKGGEGRAKKYNLLKMKSFHLAREMAPDSGRWKSRRQAAKVITAAIQKNDIASTGGMRLSELQAETTIYNWLREMPDGQELFAGKHTMPTSKDAPSAS